MAKPQTQRTIEKPVNENTEGVELSSDDLHRLTVGLAALRKTNEALVNKIERNAVLGLISYVAHEQKVGETIVGEVMTSHFGVSAVAELPSRLYQNAIEYLVDLKLDNVVN